MGVYLVVAGLVMAEDMSGSLVANGAIELAPPGSLKSDATDDWVGLTVI